MDDFTQTLIHYKISIVLLAFISFFVFERIKPIVQMSNGSSRLLNNFGLWAFNSFLSLLIILPLAKLASESNINWRPTNFPFWLDTLNIVFFLGALSPRLVLRLPRRGLP